MQFRILDQYLYPYKFFSCSSIQWRIVKTNLERAWKETRSVISILFACNVTRRIVKGGVAIQNSRLFLYPITNYKLLKIHLYIIIFRRLKFKDFSKINSELIEEKVQVCYNIFNQSNNFGIFLHKISIKDKWFEALSTNCTFKKKKKENQRGIQF